MQNPPFKPSLPALNKHVIIINEIEKKKQPTMLIKQNKTR